MSISFQMHSCAFVTRLTEQFEHEHLQNNVKNSSNTRKIRLYKIINCLTSSIKLSHKIRTTANHIATKFPTPETMGNLGTNLTRKVFWDRLGGRAKLQNGGRESQLFQKSCSMRRRHSRSEASSGNR